MDLFKEHATLAQHAIADPTLAQPLPRLTPSPSPNSDGVERYEVLIVGAGPAGLFLNLLLARLGLPPSSRLCIDSRPSATRTGHADGLHSRSLEVLKSLDLVDELLNHGCHCHEFSRWHLDPAAPEKGVVRQFMVPMVNDEARFKPQFITIHQGRIERVMEQDLAKYDAHGVERQSRLISMRLDQGGDADFPIEATIERNGEERSIRTKYLVGADGARSVVRTSMGIPMEGSMVDSIWGVVDLVADTDFPDIRRPGHINADDGTILLIPRERNPKGHCLTRLYVPFKTEQPPNSNGETTESEFSMEEKQTNEKRQRERKAEVNIDSVFERAASIFKPYYIRPKKGTQIEWWAAYQVGQRVAQRIVEKDMKGDARVFLIGDACHTHSPLAGQGMNVSMMDAYDLSWKIMYAVNGLTPDPQALFDAFAHDRHENALNLIDSDRKWYNTRFRSKITIVEPSAEYMGKERLAFISGVGVEYDEGLLVDEKRSCEDGGPIKSTDFAAKVLREGRRFADVVVTRFADGAPRHTQDDCPSDGRFRVVVFTSTDLLNPEGGSAAALKTLCEEIVPSFTPSLVELTILNPLDPHSFEWTDVPACVKATAEMRFHHGDAAAYAAYGVDPEEGAIAVVRPDGYIGSIAHLADVEKVDLYLRRCLRTAKNPGMENGTI